MVEPENAQGKDAVDGGGGLRLSYADDGLCRDAAQQASTGVGGAEAMFEVHGGAHAVDLGVQELAAQDAFEETQVIAPGAVARGGRRAVAGGQDLQGLRLGGSHLASGEAKAAGTAFESDDGAEQILLVAPDLEETAAVRCFDLVLGGAQVEEHATLVKNGGGGVLGEIVADALHEFLGRGGWEAARRPRRRNGSRGRLCGRHRRYQPIRRFRLVM